jgi:hypothetical protein
LIEGPPLDGGKGCPLEGDKGWPLEGGKGWPLEGGSGAPSSVGGLSAQAVGVSALLAAARTSSAAPRAGLRIARARRAASLQRQAVIRDLDFHLGGRWRLLIGAEEDHPARQQDHDHDHDSEEDPIHA